MKFLSGCDAVARGAWEGGAAFAGSYPGSPVTGIIDGLARYPEIKTQWMANEKIAMEVAVGVAHSGQSALVVMKHVGLNVAADPFFNVAYTGTRGALVIVVGDGIGATAYFVDDKSREKFYGPNVPYSRSFALKLRKQFNSSDLAFTYALVGDMNFMGSSYSAAIGDKLELHGELSVRDRRRAALPFVVADPAGGGYFTLRQDGQVQWRPQLLVGGQYTTEGLTNYILEYYYNGEAYGSHEFGQLQTAGILSTLQLQGPTAGQSASFLGSANGLLGSMERHYLFARVANEHWIGDLDARIYFRYGIQDSGTLLGGLLRYPLPRSAAILLGGQYYGNAAHSETASIPYEFVLYSGLTLVF